MKFSTWGGVCTGASKMIINSQFLLHIICKGVESFVAMVTATRQRLDHVCLYEVYAFRLTNGLYSHGTVQYGCNNINFTDPSFKCFCLSSKVL